MNPHYRNVRFLAVKPPDGWPERFGIVTAWNPMDRSSTADENAAAHGRLVAKVKKERLVSFSVTGGSTDMKHREPGLGIVFAREEDAVMWGQEFDQRAVFWIENGMLWLVPCGKGAKECLGGWESRIIPEQKTHENGM